MQTTNTTGLLELKSQEKKSQINNEIKEKMLHQNAQNKNRKDPNVYTYEIDENGNQRWYKNGALHREKDLPAVVMRNGDLFWHKNGMFHRDRDKPAMLYNYGLAIWWKDGLIYRDNNLPVMISPSGKMFWHKDKKLYTDFDCTIEYRF